MGLLSNEKRLHATGLVALHPPAGKLSFISQSGSMGPTVINTCERRGIGVDKFISVGNEAMVSAFDVLDYLRDDPATECVTLYLEGIDDGRHFLEAARRTTSRKPVVVLRGGLTELGGQAAASHTGALAGSAAVFHAAARQSGVVTCGTTQDLVDLGACLAYLPLPRGRRVAVITNGGGPGVLAADEVALNGLDLADLTPELVASLRRDPAGVLEQEEPPRSGRCGIRRRGPAGAGAGLPLRDRRRRAVPQLPRGAQHRGDEGEARQRRVRRLHALGNGFPRENLPSSWTETGKPIINVPDHPVHGSAPDAGHRYVPLVLASPRAAAQALAKMAWYAEYRGRIGGGS